MNNQETATTIPKVSVIVPVYNVEKYLERCVVSLRNQTLRDIEIILVDDESPDTCPALCDEYARKDPRIKVVHKKNGGLGMACNSGMEVATGKYVAFCDSDDWVEKEMYESLYRTAEEEKADLVYSGLKCVDESGMSEVMSKATLRRTLNTRDGIESFALEMIANAPDIPLERNVPMSAKVVLYRKEMLDLHNIRFESERKLITEDLFFNLDCLAKSSKIVEIPMAYYNYFINTQSLTRTIRLDRFDKIKIVYNELLKRYSFHTSEYKTRCMRLLSGYSRVAIMQIAKSNISFRDKYNYIKRICDDDIWEYFKSNYPIARMPKKHMLFQRLIQRERILLLLIFAFLKK